jgi:4-hydroxymandelate oxidase
LSEATVDLDQIQTIDELIAAARSVIDPGLYTWAIAGAGQEVTLIRNRVALNQLALMPRILGGVSELDTSSRILGVPIDIPIVMAPVGALALYHPGDAAEAARAASAAGTSVFCATQISNVTWEEVAATAPNRHFFQMYVLGDRSWIEKLVERVIAARFAGLTVTADSPAIGRRDRSLSSGYVWTVERDAVPLNLRELGVDNEARLHFGWEDLKWLCDSTDLPIILKGVLSPLDARRAVDCGVSGIYVSNHGGRTVDHSISTIEVLESITDEVGDDVDVIVDSGFTRGAEVVKALALGAKAVGLGKMQCLALSLGGQSGVARLLELLRIEVETTMRNIGAGSVADITRDHVKWSIAADPAEHPFVIG